MRIFGGKLNSLLGGIAVALLVCLIFLCAVAQDAPQLKTRQDPKSQNPDDSEQVKVFTEEVRLPLIAIDDYGHFDPTLTASDVLVLEDGVPQQVQSIRHLPASILFLLDTGGEEFGTGGMSKKTSTTRDTVRRVVAGLPPGDAIAVIQFNDGVELIQSWTRDKSEVERSLAKRLYSGRRVRLAEAVVAATAVLKERPEGSRHVVLITDGVETPNAHLTRAEAVKELMYARAAVHVISYTQLVRQKAPYKKESVLANQRRSAEAMSRAGIDPTLPPGTSRGGMGGSAGGVITFDPAMRRKRKAYEADVNRSERWLTELANETGGDLFLPKSVDEMIGSGETVARDIGAEYVLTYKPKRPLAEAEPGEYRKLEIAPRRQGVTLRTMRGYVAKGQGT